jgi:hypothetical protein
MFWGFLLIFGLVVFPVLRQYLTRAHGLRYWESAFIAFSALFAATAFLPLIGAPFVHPFTGRKIVDESIIQSAFIPAFICASVAGGLIIKRKITNRSGRD